MRSNQACYLGCSCFLPRARLELKAPVSSGGDWADRIFAEDGRYTEVVLLKSDNAEEAGGWRTDRGLGLGWTWGRVEGLRVGERGFRRRRGVEGPPVLQNESRSKEKCDELPKHHDQGDF